MGITKNTPAVNTAGSPRRSGEGSATEAQPGQKTVKDVSTKAGVAADKSHFNKNV